MRTYSSGDMAKLFCKECDGCGDCCRCMGDTIELDPYDAFQLTYGLRKDFASLIGPVVGLHENGGMVLPYMQTRPIPEEEQKARGMHFEDGQEPEECVFLSAGGRCQIHGFRPGICRLFPLGRQYAEDGRSQCYFMVEEVTCDYPKTKVRIDKWLGIPDLEDYEAFKIRWHSLVKRVQERLSSPGTDEAFRGKISTLFLQEFYIKSYLGTDFYEEVSRRMGQVEPLF